MARGCLRNRRKPSRTHCQPEDAGRNAACMALLGSDLSIRAVSYTPLDVYKRQGQGMVVDSPWGRPALSLDWLSSWADVVPAEGLAPVSYTHLDVYKRQGSLPRFVLEAGRRAGGRPQLQLLPVHEGPHRPGPGPGDRARQVRRRLKRYPKAPWPAPRGFFLAARPGRRAWRGNRGRCCATGFPGWRCRLNHVQYPVS